MGWKFGQKIIDTIRHKKRNKDILKTDLKIESNAIFYRLNMAKESNAPLDVIIPTCSKDFKKLEPVVKL